MIRVLLFALLLPYTASAQVPLVAWDHRDAMSESAWRTFGPSAPIATLAAQIHQESGWRADAVSWAGAQGRAQFMPATARDVAARWPDQCSPADPFDAEWSFRCRDLYLRSQIVASRTVRTTECDEWAFGLRRYNGGGTRLAREQRMAAAAGADPDRWREVAPFSARAPSAHKENTEYPMRIFRLESRYLSWGRGLQCM